MIILSDFCCNITIYFQGKTRMLESLFFNHSARERRVRICSLCWRSFTYPRLHLDQVEYDDSLPLRFSLVDFEILFVSCFCEIFVIRVWIQKCCLKTFESMKVHASLEYPCSNVSEVDTNILLIRTSVANWYAHLHFMSDFHLSRKWNETRNTGDKSSFQLATLEAGKC